MKRFTFAKAARALTPAGIWRRLVYKTVHRELHEERLRVRMALDAYFDRMHGVETSEQMEKDQFDIASGSLQHSEGYMPFLPQPFVETLDQIPADFSQFVFVDFGSGKGRAVLLASEFPFMKIIGIEFVPRLHRIAEENCRKYLSATQRCRALELLCMDALDFTIPPQPLVFYFYNPFDGELMSRIAGKIAQSLQEHPRPMWIVYFNPVARQEFEKGDVLEAFPIRQPTLPACPVAVWRSKV